MAYRLPNFNLSVNLWRAGVAVTNPPSLVVRGNFNWGRRDHEPEEWDTAPGRQVPTFYLLVPMGTDIRGDYDQAGNGDIAEIAAGSGKYYKVQYRDRSGLGFPNEHVAAVVVQLAPGLPPDPGGGDFVLETGGSILLEDGTPLLLE